MPSLDLFRGLPRRPRRSRVASRPAAVERLEDRLLLAATPVLLGDLNVSATYSSDPQEFTTVGSTVFFTAQIAQGGRQLWKTDGTAGGTVQITNAASGWFDPRGLTSVGSTLYFTANGSQSQQKELWSSDGTTAGTVKVADLEPVPDPDRPTWNTQPTEIAAIGSTVFFVATDAAGGTELWKTDGTTAGTMRVADINAGSESSLPQELTVVGSTLYFTATDGPANRELWKTDGSEAGTVLVKDHEPFGSSYPADLTAIGSTLYYFAARSAGAAELWKTDGTDAGTVLIKKLFSQFGVAGPANLTAVGSKLFFSGPGQGGAYTGNELWTSDGTANGTVMVTDLWSGTTSSSPRSLVAVGSKVFFSALDEDNSERRLWMSDGTAAGTVRVGNLPAGGVLTEPRYLSAIGSSLYFVASEGANGGVWRTDGTGAGAIRLADFDPGAAGPLDDPLAATALGSTVFFGAYDLAGGQEVWTSDGTTEGTSPLIDLNTKTLDSSVEEWTAIGGITYFTADSGAGREIWRTDGTSAGTYRVTTAGADSAPADARKLTAVGTTLYFIAGDPTDGDALWKSDGTTAGTVRVIDIAPGREWANYTELTAVGQTLYFAGNAVPYGHEIWKSDGTEAGTVRVIDLRPGMWGSYPKSLTAVGSILYFTAASEDFGPHELWKTDGTEAGTVRVVEPVSGESIKSPTSLIAIDDTLYFTATTPELGHELWKTDGTTAGTMLLKDIMPGWNDSSDPHSLTAVGSTLFFLATDDVAGQELWKTDGAEAGTVRLTNNIPGPDDSNIFFLTAAGSMLYFRAYEPTTGHEIWRTDGTVAGTFRVTDFDSESALGPLAAVASTVYFPVFVSGLGTELWQADGTTSGTVLAADVNPGTGSSRPTLLKAVGGTLYFVADDGVHGREPFALQLNADPTASGTTIELAEDGSGSGTVTANDPEGDALTFELFEEADHGTVVVNADGTFVYTPNEDYNGPDAFAIGARDTWDNVGFAVVTVIVTPVPDLPVASDDAVTADEDEPTSGNVVANDDEPDGPLVVTAVNGDAALVGTTFTLDSGAKLTVNADGTFVFDPSGAYMLPRNRTATETFSYTVTDGDGNTSTATVTLTVVGADEWLDGRHLRNGMWSFGISPGSVSSTDDSLGPDDVAIAPDGHYVVVFGNSNVGLFFRRFRPDGTPLDATNRQVTLGSGYSGYAHASIGMAVDGSFIISYGVRNTATSLVEVRFSRFAADGTLIAHAPSIQSSSSGSFTNIAVANDGRFVVTWWQNAGSTRFQVFHADGTPATDGRYISGVTNADVAMNPVTGEFTIVYADSLHSIMRQVLQADGTVLLEERTIATSSDLSIQFPSVAMNAAGDVFYAWRVADYSAANTQSIHFASENISAMTGMEFSESVVTTQSMTVGEVIHPTVAAASRRDTLLISWSEIFNGDCRVAYRQFNLASNPADEEIRYFDIADGVSSIHEAPTAMNERGDYVIGATGENGTGFEAHAEYHRFQPFDQIGTFKDGYWTLDLNSNGVYDAGDTTFRYGLAGDVPATGDWDGDGLTEVGVFRDGWWSLDRNGNRQFDSADIVAHYGNDGDVPVVGDWDGDGRDEVGVFRGGMWYLDADGTNSFAATDAIYSFGSPGDVPVVGDPDNAGLPMLSVFRGGYWYADANRNGSWDGLDADAMMLYGATGDQVLLGNWQSPAFEDRTGRDQAAVLRNGNWYFDLDEDFHYEATDGRTAFGPAGAYAVRGAWALVAVTSPATVPQRREIAIFRAGTWTLDANGDGRFDASTDLGFKFGSPGDEPVAGDWNGDGFDEVGVFRGGWWYLDLNGSMTFDAGDAAFKFGSAGDTPVVGDWDGDGDDEVGVFRNGVWTLDGNGDLLLDAGDAVFTFGRSGDIAVVGDWNGDGRDEVGFRRGRLWTLDDNGHRSQDPSDRTFAYGLAGDQVVVGDWNGDGFDDVGVVRDGKWYLDSDGSGVFDDLDWVFSYGLASDVALAGRWRLPV
ncbi:MAG: ELWxxDGT repeat protein [Planctomycetaceae bacterium]